MSADYQRKVRAEPQPTLPLREAGLHALKPLLAAVSKLPAAKTAPILNAVSTTVSGIAPLRLFDDFSPAHAPPEVPLVINETQLSADSTRSGSSYAVIQAFSDTAPPVKKNSTTYWCSKQRPSNSKSSITVQFIHPEQLTGLYVALPEAKLQSEFVGFEALVAPEDINTQQEINTFFHSRSANWQPLGVIPAATLAAGVRLPVTSHRCIGLRISFKGFAKANTDKYHALATTIIYVASNRLRRGTGGTTLYTESAAVLESLADWLHTCGVSLHGSDAQVAAIKSLCGLTLASGSLQSVLALVKTLLHHKSALPDDLGVFFRRFVAQVDDRFDAVGVKCNGEVAAGGVANPDKTDEAKFVDMSSSVSITDGDAAHRVRSSSSPEYAAINIGISKGRMVWEMKIVEDSRDGECQCFGFCKKPVANFSYDSTSDMWLWRAYNGQLYDRGSSTQQKSKFHQDDIIRFELDMDVGECRGYVNGADQGVLFSGLNGQGWTLYPCVQFYSSGRASSLEKVFVYDGSASSGGSTAYLCQVKEVADETVCHGVLGKGATLSSEITVRNADGSSEKRKCPMTLQNGSPVRQGLAIPLQPTAGSAHVTYNIGIAADEKRKKEAQPSLFDTFEAFVGIADFLPEGSNAPASTSTPPSSAVDEDSKEDVSGTIESKEDTPAPAVAAPSGSVRGSATASSASSGPATKVTFKVIADGTTVWTSPVIEVPEAGLTAGDLANLPVHACSVKLANVHRIELRVETSGPTKDVHAVWGDARLSVSPWLHERRSFEDEMQQSLGKDVPEGVELLEDAASPTSPTATKSLPIASELVTKPLKQIIHEPPKVFTNRLLRSDVNLTGPVAAAALLRVLRLFAREAYKPVRVTKPAPGFGEPSLPLEIPFVVQVDGKVLNLFAVVLQQLSDALPASGDARGLIAEMISSVLLILKGNVRRIVASKVLPADVGIHAKTKTQPGTLDRLLEVLNGLMEGAKSSKKVPAELAAAAAGVLDTGLQLFYPTPAAQSAFLTQLLGKGEGGVLEVHFSWPTKLAQSDKAVADASAEVPPALTKLYDSTDPRFERAILLLQAYASRRGFAHTTVGHYGKFIHLIISLPDTAERPIVQTLSTDLAQLFASAGLLGWTFPQGCSTPEISFKIERFLEFDRRERLATDPGVGWLRLYPRRVGTFDQVVAEAQQFIASFVAAEQAQTTEVAPKEGAVAEASTLDVFGDKVTARDTDEADHASVASGSASRSSGGGDLDDDEDEDEEEEDEDESGEESHEDDDGDEDDEDGFGGGLFG